MPRSPRRLLRSAAQDRGPSSCADAAAPRLRQVGGSGVLVQPMTYIFDEEPKRWRALLNELGVPDYTPAQNGNGA